MPCFIGNDIHACGMDEILPCGQDDIAVHAATISSLRSDLMLYIKRPVEETTGRERKG